LIFVISVPNYPKKDIKNTFYYFFSVFWNPASIWVILVNFFQKRSFLVISLYWITTATWNFECRFRKKFYIDWYAYCLGLKEKFFCESSCHPNWKSLRPVSIKCSFSSSSPTLMTRCCREWRCISKRTTSSQRASNLPQKVADTAQRRCDQNRMRLIITKCKMMHF